MKENLKHKKSWFEHRNEPLLPRPLFIKRLLKHLAIGMLIIFVSLSVGVIGYHIFENLGWIDSLLNASMILGGMGPVNELRTDAGKIFASFYALFSGIVFLVTVGIILAPVVHRLLHSLHIDADDKD